VIGAFNFEHAGRQFRCTPEKRHIEPIGTWWWFSVSNDGQRYAPFEVASGDTQASVRARVVKYYEHLQWVRAQPPAPRQQFSRPGRPAKPPVPGSAPAVPAAAPTKP
jgi:hypothetical protein